MVLVQPESGVGFNGVAPVVPDTNTIPPSSSSGRAQSLRRDLRSKGHAPYDRRSTNAKLLNFPRHARQFQLVLLLHGDASIPVHVGLNLATAFIRGLNGVSYSRCWSLWPNSERPPEKRAAWAQSPEGCEQIEPEPSANDLQPGRGRRPT